MKIYLASSWRNTYQASVLAELRAAGHEVYDFKNPEPGNTGFGWKQCTDDPLTSGAVLRNVLAHPVACAGFMHDFRAMQWADACVLLLPCGNSSHEEAGWFAGRGKPVAICVPELRSPELMYKMHDSIGGATPLFDSMADLLGYLSDPPHLAYPSERDVNQGKLVQWALQAFGVAETCSVEQRTLRLLEESLEAYQAAGGTAQAAHALADYVFSRPVGDIKQEVAQVSICATLLAGAAGVSIGDVERDEIKRIESTDPAHFTARNAAKNAAGLKAGDLT